MEKVAPEKGGKKRGRPKKEKPSEPECKQKGKRKDRKNPTSFSTLKVPLNKVICKKKPELLYEINLAVRRANTFTMRAYELLKYFLITEFQRRLLPSSVKTQKLSTLNFRLLTLKCRGLSNLYAKDQALG